MMKARKQLGPTRPSRHRISDARPGNEKPVTGSDLRAAVDAVLAGNPIPTPQKPAVGCGIKWKK